MYIVRGEIINELIKPDIPNKCVAVRSTVYKTIMP